VARIRQDDIDAVKERTDIVQLVGNYLTLKKSGHDSLSGLCPFHQEKTASFSVSPSKQVFYCFGCGKGGDAITFLRELEHLSYVEAIERLAQTVGVHLRYEGDSLAERRAAERRAALYRANEEAAALYRTMLAGGREAEDARAYVTERGIAAEAIERFGIGYAPGYADFLLRRLVGSSGLSPEILLEAGLATRGDDGTVRDRFRGRITFPIEDLQGRNIGFGARVLPSDPRAGEQAKYLNTAETPIYRKQEILYNLHRARSTIARSGEAFVVEGYTDVIGLAQAGIDNVVATCGTALGEKHLALLSRFAERAVLAFDSDEAGARAAERASAFQEAFPIQAVVMVIPEGLDPAEFVA
jgi:DNA primase